MRIEIPAVLVLAAIARAAPIPIANPSFEADPAPDGNYVVLSQVQGWDLYDPNGLINQGANVIGVICPIGSGYYTPDEAPDQRNGALIFIQSSIGQGPMGLEQALGVDLAPNTTYTLSYFVGDIAMAPGIPPNPPDQFPLNGFPGYAVQLLAGGQVLVEDDNQLDATLDDGDWGENSLQHTTGPSVQPNLELAIRLINLNEEDTPEDPGIEVNFDHIRLDASPAAPGCAGDVNGDGVTDVFDFGDLAANFGAGPGATRAQGDLTGDGFVDVFDFGDLAADFGCVAD
jgi:hypothetical protein